MTKGTTTQTDVVQAFGTPDLVTHKDGQEIWTYDKTSYDYERRSDYATAIFIGQSGDRVRSSSKSTLLIIYFNDKDVVTDYRPRCHQVLIPGASKMIRILIALLVGSMFLTGCHVDKKYSQTELNALQTREFDYPMDPTFDAAVGALFDLGYTIHTSDKRGGLLGAGMGYGDSVQIKLDQAAPGHTSVRVSTASGGQAHVDKARIDAVLDSIDRAPHSLTREGRKP